MPIDPNLLYQATAYSVGAASSFTVLSGLSGASFEWVRQELENPTEDENKEKLGKLRQERDSYTSIAEVPKEIWIYGREEVIRQKIGEIPEYGQKDSQRGEEEWKYQEDDFE